MSIEMKPIEVVKPLDDSPGIKQEEMDEKNSGEYF